MTSEHMTTAARMPATADRLEESLFEEGYARLPGVLDEPSCRRLRECFEDDALFRSHVAMERHGFGRGDYKYFRYPLVEPIASLRASFYALLAPIAGRWNERLGDPQRFPPLQQAFLDFCAEREQARPTALLLRYRTGDYNCFHQDVYGAVAFPFQMTVFFSERDAYQGGEFVLLEQRPRRQSRPIVLRPGLGEALVFPNRYRPVRGAKGDYRTAFRHGVSEVRSGARYALGIIFHDAR